MKRLLLPASLLLAALLACPAAAQGLLTRHDGPEVPAGAQGYQPPASRPRQRRTRSGSSLRFFPFNVMPLFYRVLAGLGLLAGLTACHRATYSFSGQPAYLAAPVTVAADAAGTLAAPAASPTPLARPEAPRLAGAGRHRARRVPAYAVVRPRHQRGRGARPGRTRPSQRAPAQSTAGSGPYFSGADFGAALALLALYALLVTALVVVAATLLVKLIVRLTRGKSRRAAQPLPAPRTGP